MAPKIIRASSLSGWTDCARRAAATIFREEIVAAGFDLRERTNSIGASVGTATHAGAGHALTEKMAGRPMGEVVAIDAAQAALDESLTEAAVTWDDTTPVKNVAQGQVSRMVRTYINQVAKAIEPAAVEQRLYGRLGDNIILSGQKDVLAIDPSGMLADLKTGVVERSSAIQLGAYSLLEKANGQNVLALRQDFIKRARLDRPQPVVQRQHYDVDVAEGAAVEALADIERAHGEFQRRVVAGDWPPEGAFRANPMSYLCSAKWCSAWGTAFCRLHKQEKS